MISCKTGLMVILLLLTQVSLLGQEFFLIEDYYPIADKNEWRYVAPEGWKDGDYISKVVAVPNRFVPLFGEIKDENGESLFQLTTDDKTFRHFDATKASKLLSVNENGVVYHGETFSSDGSIAVFESPIAWFKEKEHIGSRLSEDRKYIRYYKDGTTREGIFTITQTISKKEDVRTPAGEFKNCLRIEFDTYWDLGEGMEAKSINVYHHAKDIGVVKASARFIILKNGAEIINRLVEPDLKSYVLQKKSLSLPNIRRIKMATVVTEDVRYTKKLYRDWLNYEVVEEGTIPSVLANCWGAPNMIDKPYAILQSESGDDVFLRVIEGTVPEDYKALTTFGWNAIELIVKDPDAIYEKLINSPFEHIGGPENLGGGLSTIRAVQFKGPSEEVFYFTTDTGDRSKSTLLTPRTFIDRPFIMVLAGPDTRALTDFYVANFDAKEAFYIEASVGLIASAQNLKESHKFPLSLLRLGVFSNSIEIDGYPQTAGIRTVSEGELPPGVSIASFTIRNLDLLDQKLFITAPIKFSGVGYDENRMATILGPAGELIELIEERQP